MNGGVKKGLTADTPATRAAHLRPDAGPSSCRQPGRLALPGVCVLTMGPWSRLGAS
jgi:hypothetical protein